MIFESLWPLALLTAVPVVIILYLLKPRGKDYRISSNLLWEKLFRNQESKTFFEKFIHNILMYLQILIILLLVLALMSPYIHRRGESSSNMVFVLDTSGSMQHDAGNGRTRLEEALTQVRDLISASDDAAFSIVSSDCTGSRLLAMNVKDKNSLYRILDEIDCCDGPGGLQDAENIVETLLGGGLESENADPEVIVYTDGNGAGEAAGFSERFGARILVMGEAADNVSNNFLSYTETPAGDGEKSTFVCASGITNYGGSEAVMEVSLYEGERLLEIRQLTLGAGETTLCFFEEFYWQGEPLRSEISSVKFAGTERGDSLAQDNISYAVPGRISEMNAVLIGEGNTYLEKAYQAATGMSLTRAKDESVLESEVEDGRQPVYIYDAGAESSLQDQVSSLSFGGGNETDTVERVLLTVSDCDLTSGLSSFSIGVNETKVYEIPQWGRGFLWAGDECAGYYGEHDGIRTIVVGFDLRESDFPLKAEFPVFMSNALHFLSDTSLLAADIYRAGDSVIFHPQADFDVNTLTARTDKAGLYEISAGDITEQYVVRFAVDTQSDGRLAAEGIEGSTSYGSRIVRKQLRQGILVLVLILMALEWYLYVRQTRNRGIFYPMVRLAGALLVILALLGISVGGRNPVNTTIFLVDISNSNEQNLSAMETWLDDTLNKMPGRNQYGIVTFGKNSLVEQFLTQEHEFSKIMSLPDKSATNFEDAMSKALSMIPENGAGRLVILTDGRETKGNLANLASALISGQTELLAAVYPVSQGQDAYVDNVEMPGYLYQGDSYSMTVTVESNYETDAKLRILMGSMETESYDVHLGRGTNQFRLRQEVRGENIESFEVKVEAAGDTCEENNGYHVFSVVDSVPRVLVISGRREDSTQYETLLHSANCNFSTVSAVNAPSTLDGLLEFRSIILENVYLSDLPSGFLENIETYVRDYGCGLVCCGGEESYALGGYRDSILETVLPVDMELRGVDEIPKMAMIMVIDHSGSMSSNVGSGATNLDLAITAAKTAVDQMRSTDFTGVVSFDDSFSWVVEPVEVSDRENIKKQIETIADGGGTTIKPALWAALDGVLSCDVSIRHVILLTDGQGESRSFSDITESYNDAGVTLSTVAVGAGSDARLLEQIADACGGRFYYSDMAADIPKIFAQEVFLSGDTYLQNGVFGLAVSNSEITGGLFESGWPQIYGYVSATPKGSSRVLIASEKDDPILTVMQYGLGHTVAWNTDVTNQWTANFAGADDYVQLWKRIIDYSTGNAALGEDSVDVMTAGGLTDVVYHALDYSEQTKVEAVYTDPEGNTYTAPLQAVAPGRYEAKLDTDMTGIYNLSVRRIDNKDVTNSLVTATAVQYSDEYKFDISTSAFVDFVERYGSLLDPDENIWKQRKSGAKERYDLTKWLILLAVLWFVMDVAFRRFHFLPQNTKICRRISDMAARRKAARESDMAARRKAIRESGDENTPPDSRQEEGREAAEPERPAKTIAADRKARRSSKRHKKQEEQVLDTSALLKKKDQRNQ